MAVRVAFDQVDSTQTEALRLANEGADAGTIVVAHRQRSGRGRLDHAWASPPGGLYVSVVCRPPKHRALLVPLSVGVELRRAFVRRYAISAVVKWPNDVVVPDETGRPRKLAGVLVDRVVDRSGAVRLVVGVGVNVLTDRAQIPLELRARMAILSELVRPPPSLGEVETEVVAAIGAGVEKLNSPDGPDEVIAECRRHLYGVGRQVRVDGRLAGVLRALEEDGSATVERDGELHRILAGDLELEVVP